MAAVCGEGSHACGLRLQAREGFCLSTCRQRAPSPRSWGERESLAERLISSQALSRGMTPQEVHQNDSIRPETALKLRPVARLDHVLAFRLAERRLIVDHLADAGERFARDAGFRRPQLRA